MKTKLIAAFAAALVLCHALSALAQGASIYFFWLPNPPGDLVTGYKLYSLIGTNRTQRASTSGTNSTVILPDGTYQLALTATNVNAESDLGPVLWVFVSGTNYTAVTNKPSPPGAPQLR